MKYVLLVAGVLVGFVLGVAFGPTVKAYWEERELRATSEALDTVEGALADLVTLPERRATLLNERVELATDLAVFRSYEDLKAEPPALEKLHRLFAIEHEIVELDERERWLRATRDELEGLREQLSARVAEASPIPDAEWPGVRAVLDGAPTPTPPRPSGRVLQRLFDSLGGT